MLGRLLSASRDAAYAAVPHQRLSTDEAEVVAAAEARAVEETGVLFDLPSIAVAAG
eukprot:CAMPEP_0195143644 /NCGR_PEP_ID=MMETSP0448-20130528/166726_1 /TAXON_ID=66468 /ORGANISM="Heterocapsa triquestra, Strain CCMP 448" /LENGTH=55 /DNA_ID=CAMNT_0040182085 /DNA_START=465 /DNA_END=628 /DNA_ORIENTATION=-